MPLCRIGRVDSKIRSSASVYRGRVPKPPPVEIRQSASEIHGRSSPQRHEADVDGDGDVDLVIHVRLGDTHESFGCDATTGTLTGATFDGQPIEGSDAVNMVAPRGAH